MYKCKHYLDVRIISNVFNHNRADARASRPKEDEQKTTTTNCNQTSEKHLKMRLESEGERIDEATKRYYLHLIVVHTEIKSN